jgi:hypothetical protein
LPPAGAISSFDNPYDLLSCSMRQKKPWNFQYHGLYKQYKTVELLPEEKPTVFVLCKADYSYREPVHHHHVYVVITCIKKPTSQTE